MKAGADGKMPYKNIFDTMLKTIKKEGFGHLWIGYLTFYLRIAPHVGITLILQDYLTHHMRDWRAKKRMIFVFRTSSFDTDAIRYSSKNQCSKLIG